MRADNALLEIVSQLVKLAFRDEHDGLRLVFLVTLLAQPYFLLRLVHHFRPVPRALRWSVMACTTIGTVVLLAIPKHRPAWLVVSTALYFLTAQGYAGWAFLTEARQTGGVTGWRLRFAASGAWFSCAILAVDGVAKLSPHTTILPPAGTRDSNARYAAHASSIAAGCLSSGPRR